MKLRKLVISLVATICFFSSVYSEKVWVTGDYTTPGEVRGDLVVTNGNVDIPPGGDLIVTGDLKVTNGYVWVSCGNLRVDGDLIVTNETALIMKSMGGPYDAFVEVFGDLEVTGAIITKSRNGKAYVGVYDSGPPQEEPPNGIGGNLKAGRITTKGNCDSYVRTSHFFNVIGAVVTHSVYGDASVGSVGHEPNHGDVYAGSIFTRSDYLDAHVHAFAGHLIVNGPIITDGGREGYVKAEGNLRAASIFTRNRGEVDEQYEGCEELKNVTKNGICAGHAYVKAESIEVRGDIRTDSKCGHGYVLSEYHYVVHGDIIANNIYTKGYESAYVKADRHIEVKGDIVTWKTEEEDNGDSAYVEAGVLQQDPYFWAGHIKAQNIITRAIYGDAYVKAKDGIYVTGEIITKSKYKNAYVYNDSDILKAGNIATEVEMSYRNNYVQNDDIGIDVTHVIRTDWTGDYQRSRNGCPERSDVYASDGSINAEKIFIDGYCKSTVRAADDIIVKGPIVTKSYNGEAYIDANNNLRAGAISTNGSYDSFVNAEYYSIDVVEDIRTRSYDGDANVHALNGSIKARSIKTDSEYEHADDSIKAAAGSGEFQLFPNLQDQYKALIIKDSNFDLNSDYEWDLALSLQGTCTLNGKGHHLNFGPSGRIYVTAGSVLYLRNIDLRNIGGIAVSCNDDTATLHLDNVTWTLTADYEFKKGTMHVDGDFNVNGPGHSFVYQSGMQSTIHPDAKLLFDHKTTLSYDTGSDDRILMVDGSSQLCFDESVLHAEQNMTLTNGKLRFDNKVTFSAVEGTTITFGDGVPGNNLGLEFGKGSKLVYVGNLVNSNA